ncbi:hypothetical protein D3C72_2450860 [compost metagenome]
MLVKKRQRAIFGLHGADVVIAAALVAVKAMVRVIHMHLHVGLHQTEGLNAVQRNVRIARTKVRQHRNARHAINVG